MTLTDYALVLECATCAAFLGLAPAGRRLLRGAGVCLFSSLGGAAAAGGTVHGFFPDERSAGCRLLWLLTLQLMGLTALSAWVLGAGMLRPDGALRRLVMPALIGVVGYEAAVLLLIREYWVAMTIYLPATALLLVGYCRAFRRSRHRHFLAGAMGLLLTFVAAFIQVMRFGIHPAYFDHNALYHAVQAVALVLIFLGTRCMISLGQGGEDSPPDRDMQSLSPKPWPAAR